MPFAQKINKYSGDKGVPHTSFHVRQRCRVDASFKMREGGTDHVYELTGGSGVGGW